MSFVVPFDGSELAEAALVRALEYARALDEDVVAVTIVPERTRYAREKGWIDEDESYAVDAVVEELRGRVVDLAPEADFAFERIREFPPAEELAERIERLAQQHDPSVVFLGSENVGSVVTPVASVAARVAEEEAYDVYIVRHASPSKVGELEDHPDFYDGESAE